MFANVAFALANTVPAPFRLVLGMSARGVLPYGIVDHWVGLKIAEHLFQDGILASMNGQPMHLPTHSLTVFREYEQRSIGLVRERVKPGMVFLDVGANAGFYSIVANKLGADVIAIEPSPKNLRLLRRNLSLHNAHATIHEIGAGSVEEDRTFMLTLNQGTDGFFANPFNPPIAQTTVSVRPLDSVIKGRVDFIKMDIEGAEIDALKGMERILSGDVSLLVEWAPGVVSADPMELPSFLESRGFTLTGVDDNQSGQLISIEEMKALYARNPKFYGNILATRA